MSIQGNINQLFRDVGYMTGLGMNAYQQSDVYKGKQYQKQFEGSKNVLYDMYKNLKNPAKNYSEVELKDIEARQRDINKSIYDVKVAELDPRYKKRIDTSSLKQRNLSQINKEMMDEIAARRNAFKQTPLNPLDEVSEAVKSEINALKQTPWKDLPKKEVEVEVKEASPAPTQYPLLPEQVAIPQPSIEDWNYRMYTADKNRRMDKAMMEQYGELDPSTKAYRSLIQNAKSKLDRQTKIQSDIPEDFSGDNSINEQKAIESLENKMEEKASKNATKNILNEEKTAEEYKAEMEKDPLYKGVQLAERGNVANKSKVGNTQIFTRQREVNQMIKSITDADPTVITDFNRTWLEPTSGEGAFTTNILAKRMRHALETYTTEKDFLRNSAKAVATIYSIEPMGDTHSRQLNNLKSILNNAVSEFEKKNGITIDKNGEEYKAWVKKVDEILGKNIIHGYFGDTMEQWAKGKSKKEYRKMINRMQEESIGYMADKNSDIDYTKPIEIHDFRNDDYFKEDNDGTEK